MKCIIRVVLASLSLALSAPGAEETSGKVAGIELEDGDRVVLIGDTLIERDAEHGYLETLLTSLHPDRRVTFRNLGWSGDTVFGHARAGFGTPADGFKQLEGHVLGLKPTVILVGYGMSDSFEGEAGLSRFVEGLDRLLDVLARTGARIALISPIPHERADLGPGSAELADRHNRALGLYRGAIEKAARDRKYAYVDLSGLRGPAPLTDNGIHLTAPGYWEFARAVAGQLGLLGAREDWSLTILPDGKVAAGPAIDAPSVRASAEGVRFEGVGRTLPAPRRPGPSGAAGSAPPSRTLRVEGLAPGRYALKVDGKAVATSDAAGWAQGVAIESGPDFDQAEALRRAIVEKNRLYFYRWRPQNETYLFGFRKHEQGNNAREIPEFDPLVDEKEAEIARLRVPARHSYELARDGDAGR